MDSSALTFAQVTAVLAQRRLDARARTAVGAEAGSQGGEAGEQAEALRSCQCQAARHCWLALEVGLAGPGLWQQLTDFLPVSQQHVFRQQMDALLDLLNLAGLGTDDAETRRDCQQELRAGRQAGLLSADGVVEALSLWNCNGAAEPHEPWEAEWHWIDQLAGILRQAGYQHLARLVALSSLRDEPLIVGMVAYFLHRAVRSDPDLNADQRDPTEEPFSDSWNCLETMARLLDGRAEALEELLDNPEEAAPSAAVSGRDDVIEKLFQLALSQCQNAEYQEALSSFTAALKLDPANPVLYAHRGDTYRLLCEQERALADFNAALQLNPADADVLVSRATAYHLSGKCERAIADCTTALALNPGHTAAYRARAAAHADLGAYDLALADFSAAIRQAPDDGVLLHQRGVIFAQKAEYAQAIADFNRVLELNRDYVLAYLHRGHAHRGCGDHTQAILDYSEVLQRHPRNALAYASRGLAYELKGEPLRAIADYSEALRLEPANARVYCGRGILYRFQGDLDRALADFDEAIRRQRENWTALYHRGRVRLAKAQMEQALADLTEALYLNPRLVPAYLSRALIHDRLGQYAEALENCGRALKLDAGSAAYLVRGVVASHAADPAQALADLSEAARLDPQCGLAYHERGMLHTLQGDYDRALADYSQLLALEPRNALAYVSRGVVHQCKGNEARALFDFSRAMQIDPKCMLAGLNQGRADLVRQQTTELLADYVEGLRPKRDAEEAPRPADFLLARAPQPASKQALARATAVRKKTIRAAAATDPALPAAQSNSTVPTTLEADATAELPSAPPPPKKAKSEAPEEIAPASKQGTRKKAPPSNRKAEESEPPVEVPATPGRRKTQATPAPTEQTEEIAVEQTAPQEKQAAAALTPDTSEMELVEISWEDIPDKEPKEAAPKPAVAAPRPQQLCCPMCQRWGIPTERLPDGRARCMHCQVMFLPSPVAAPPPSAAPVVAKPTKKKQPKDQGGIFRSSRAYLLAYPFASAVVVAAALVLVILGHLSYTWIAKPVKPPATPHGDVVTVEEVYKRSPKDRRLSRVANIYWAVTVTGEVEEVDPRERLVYMKRAATDGGKVVCHLAYADEVSWAQPGSKATIRGVCEGRDIETLAVHLVACQIIP